MNVEFKTIIKKIKERTGWNQKEIAANIFNITDKNLWNRIKRNSVDFIKLIEWGVNNGVDLNWLLLDIETSQKEGSSKSDGIIEEWCQAANKNEYAEAMLTLIEHVPAFVEFRKKNEGIPRFKTQNSANSQDHKNPEPWDGKER